MPNRCFGVDYWLHSISKLGTDLTLPVEQLYNHPNYSKNNNTISYDPCFGDASLYVLCVCVCACACACACMPSLSEC